MDAIERAFGRAGLVFIRPDAHGGEGVRLVDVQTGERRKYQRRRAGKASPPFKK
jgi:hypothetical protein